MACAIAVVSSWTNFGHLCGDEYSQIFEFAAWKLGYVAHADLRLWEFDSQMRPSIQVWMVVAMYRLVGLFTNEVNPFTVNYIIYLASGIFSIASILVFTNAFIHRVRESYRNYFVLLSLFTWLVLYSNTCPAPAGRGIILWKPSKTRAPFPSHRRGHSLGTLIFMPFPGRIFYLRSRHMVFYLLLEKKNIFPLDPSFPQHTPFHLGLHPSCGLFFLRPFCSESL